MRRNKISGRIIQISDTARLMMSLECGVSLDGELAITAMFRMFRISPSRQTKKHERMEYDMYRWNNIVCAKFLQFPVKLV